MVIAGSRPYKQRAFTSIQSIGQCEMTIYDRDLGIRSRLNNVDYHVGVVYF